MNVHFIAIGGSAMHNLAIALHKKGVHVTGSDDEIFEPARSRLQKYGLLPDKIGWDENHISESIDAIVLGMHAKADNPELLKAQKLGLKIYSYPEYLYEQSKNKIRIVIGGSHGKTTITAMILHVLQTLNIETDYMVGAQLDGFEVMVKFTETAKYMVIEGDEYLTSPIDRRPKFHVYKPHIALISGIAWDHINVFPTFEIYKEQFSIFTNLIEPNGHLVYCSEDDEVKAIAEGARSDLHKHAYSYPDYTIENGITNIIHENKIVPLQIFGKHNLLNLNGAKLVCKAIGIAEEDFYKAISTFKGASKRLELVKKNDYTAVYKDFAHAPSKLKATIKAVKEQFPQHKLVACMELHTYSSLNKDFLIQYQNSMNEADVPIVFYSQHAFEIKKMPLLEEKMVQAAFGRDDLQVITKADQLKDFLLKQNWYNTNLLMMSSGNFDGLDIVELANNIIQT